MAAKQARLPAETKGEQRPRCLLTKEKLSPTLVNCTAVRARQLFGGINCLREQGSCLGGRAALRASLSCCDSEVEERKKERKKERKRVG